MQFNYHSTNALFNGTIDRIDFGLDYIDLPPLKDRNRAKQKAYGKNAPAKKTSKGKKALAVKRKKSRKRNRR